MMQKEEAITLMAFPLLLVALLGVVSSFGGDMLIIGFVFSGLGAIGIAAGVVLLVLGVLESGFVLILGFIVAAVGGLTSLLA